VLVRCLAPSDKKAMEVGRIVRRCARSVLDFALPPRCAGCGTIVEDVHSFCPDCWKQVEFLGDAGCRTCGIPLAATEADTCGVCLARPPRIERTRAAVAYDELSRSLAIRLKYGRKVAVAKTMARYMQPLIRTDGGRLIVPVPLHRTRSGGADSTSRHLWRANCRGGSEFRRTSLPCNASVERRRLRE